MQRILITGGAGYIGSILTRQLLEAGYDVTVVDRLMFGGEHLADLLNSNHFRFIQGDILDGGLMKTALQDIDGVVHLAAIVGDPACGKTPELARSVNLEGSKALYALACEQGVKRFVFASTCSNYGRMKDRDSFLNEDSPLSPVSLYAETKVAVEQHLLGRDKASPCKPLCLRFSTVYGLSPRMRFDLTVNEFVRDLALGKSLEVFGEQFWRPYCHVIDLARSVGIALKAESRLFDFKVYNIGDNGENYTKKMIVEAIGQQLPGLKVEYVHKDEDPRDYKVDFTRAKNELGFAITKRIPDGISQMIAAVRGGLIADPYSGRYSNS